MWTFLTFLAAAAAATSWLARLLPPATGLGAAATVPCFESANATLLDPKAGGPKLGLAASVAEVVEVKLPCAGFEVLCLDRGDSSIVSSCQPAVRVEGMDVGCKKSSHARE